MRIAAGLFDRNWRLDEARLEQADPAVRAKCPMLKVRPDLTTYLTGLPQIRPEVYDAYAGQYQAEGAIATLVRQGDRLVVQLPNQPSFALYPESETEFSVEGADVQVNFFRDPAGKVTHLTVQQPDRPEMSAQKIK